MVIRIVSTELMRIPLRSIVRLATAALPNSLLAVTAAVSTATGRVITITIVVTDRTKDPNVTANTALARRRNSLAKTLNVWPNRITATRKTIAATGRTNGIVPTPEEKVEALLWLPVLMDNSNVQTAPSVLTKVWSATKSPIAQMIATNLFSAESTNVSRYHVLLYLIIFFL